MSIDSYRRGRQIARYLDAFCLNATMQSPDFGEDGDPDPTDYEELPDPEESVRDCDKPDAKNCKTNVTQYQLTSQDVEEIKAYAEKYYHGDTTLAEYWWRRWNDKNK